MFNKIVSLFILAVSVTLSQSFDRNYVGVAFSPYTKHWEGTKLPFYNSYSIHDIEVMLNVVHSHFTHIATYGMGVAEYNKNNKWDHADSNCLVSRAAAHINRNKKQNAIKVAQGINQQQDPHLQNKEIEHAFAAAHDANTIHHGTVWGLTFTNEYFTNEATGNHIFNMIKSHKAKAHKMHLQVGTRINVCGHIMEGGAMHNILANIVKESDFIMCNLYPPNNAHDVHHAVEAVGNAFLSYVPKFRAINPHIKIMIGETGWPSAGVSFNHSPNDAHHLKSYWTEMGKWAAKHHVLVHMFEAIDEPWKSSKTSHDKNSPSGPNGGEGHYGWWKREGNKFVEK